jgi:hypothetical protein
MSDIRMLASAEPDAAVVGAKKIREAGPKTASPGCIATELELKRRT